MRRSPEPSNEKASAGRRVKLVVRGFAQPAELLLDSIVEAAGSQIDRNPDRVREAERIGSAVALHRDSVKPEEHGTVVSTRVGAHLHLPERAPCKEKPDLGDEGAFERLPDELTQEPCRPFRCLECYIAGEAVGHDDVD